ncbi:MAG TPA: TauD/TfdA family dioxygenase [Stellaceae bacterium]|jgi:alpha-ketoglutarate-dependent 2,4-dichlorophenoxyacetate dioxygenase
MTIGARSVNPKDDNFFGEIAGVDLKADLDRAAIAAIEAAMDRYAVCVVRGQFLDDEQQIEFSLKLGELSYAINYGRAQNQAARLRRELYDISNLNEGDDILANDDRRRVLREGDRLWHTDRSFIPADTTYSLLSARKVPPEGGNTEFADMRAAYDALPEAVKVRMEALSCEHSIWHSRVLAGAKPEDIRPNEREAMPGTVQPLVRIHARTGRKSLVLASHAMRVVGLPDPEGRALLDQLTKFAIQDRFVYSHRWSAGELVIWDNRCTMHRGTPFDDRRYRRDMRRTTVQNPRLATTE